MHHTVGGNDDEEIRWKPSVDLNMQPAALLGSARNMKFPYTLHQTSTRYCSRAPACCTTLHNGQARTRDESIEFM